MKLIINLYVFLTFSFFIVFFLPLVNSFISRGSKSSSSTKSNRFPSTKLNYNNKQKIKINNYYSRPWGPDRSYSWYSYGQAGYIYGFHSYTTSRLYREHPEREPTICRNEYDHVRDNDTSVTYEWFICPNNTLPREYNSCCGPPDKEYCCKRYHSSNFRSNTVGGSVSSIIIFIGFVACIYCCCCRFPREQQQQQQQQPYFQRVFTSRFKSGDNNNNVFNSSLNNNIDINNMNVRHIGFDQNNTGGHVGFNHGGGSHIGFQDSSQSFPQPNNTPYPSNYPIVQPSPYQPRDPSIPQPSPFLPPSSPYPPAPSPYSPLPSSPYPPPPSSSYPPPPSTSFPQPPPYSEVVANDNRFYNNNTGNHSNTQPSAPSNDKFS